MKAILFLLISFLPVFAGAEIVAKVNGKVITKDEFETQFKLFWDSKLHLKPRKPTREDKKLFLFELIKGLVIEEVANKMGIRVEEKELREALRRWGIKKAKPAVKSLVRRELLINKVSEVITSGIYVSDDEVRAYYLMNKREFYYPKRVKLLPVIAKTKSRARKAKRSLEKGKVPYWEEGVIVGKERWYSVEALPRKVRRQLWPLRVGTVSNPIKIDSMYLVFKITDKKEAGILSFEEAKDMVRDKLVRKKRQEVFKEWFRETLKRYRLELYLQHL